MTEKNPTRRPYERPRVKYDRKIDAVASLCAPSSSADWTKADGTADNGFGNPCTDPFT